MTNQTRSEPDTSDIPKKNKFVLAIMALVAVATFSIGLVLAAYSAVNYKYEVTPKQDKSQYVFTVPKGAGLSKIALDLDTQGLINSEFIFKLVTKLRGNEANFKAGEYQLELPLSMSTIYDILSEGKALLYPITVAEGRTSAQIVRQLDQYDWLIKDEVTIPAEGMLLPETYLLPRNMKHSEVLARMRQDQVKTLDELWESRQPNLPFSTKAEAIILASIVEKETGIGGERGRVAGVFVNRLRKGMMLQSDPTIIYGISRGEILRNKKGEQRGLRRSEIDRKTDWNTYQIEGLPKTAICNPGRAAIAAVLNPEETNDLYFVADGTGGHVFAPTLAQHNRNVAQWRVIERKLKRERAAAQNRP